MTKSTIIREQQRQILIDTAQHIIRREKTSPYSENLRELARIALSAMDSESWCLPLDYLQGHKDGLEWASQLAEANHPETGDWLYDDPIELAKAIRKGPDMPPAQPAADSEPVAIIDQANLDYLRSGADADVWPPEREEMGDVLLYRHAQPAPERDRVRCEHAEWSHATFGNVGPVGPLKHLSKEALEAAAEPDDLSEWADMQFLMWDAQRRAGVTDEQITQAMIDKLAVNKQREWPEPKDGEPRVHIKSQPAPVVQCVPLGDSPYDVPYSMPSNLRELIAEEIGILFSDDDAQGVWIACRRAAMLATSPQSPGSELATVPGKWIPVSERMPEVGVKVLCFPAEDEPIHAVFNGQLWLQDISWSNSDEPIDNVITCNVTHWVPLPASPQEVK